MGTLKGKSAMRVFNQFPELKQRPYWGNHFWAEGYCVDKKGNIYFIDSWLGQIKKFDKNGNFVNTFGEIREFARAKYIVVDKENNFIILNNWKSNNNNILLKEFDSNFKFKKDLSFKTEKTSNWLLNVDNNNRLFVINQSTNEVNI